MLAVTELTDAVAEYLSLDLHLLALKGKRPNPRYHSVNEDGVGWSWERSIWGVPESDEERSALDEVFTHPSTTGVAILIPQHVYVADVDTDEAAALFEEYAGGVPETRTAKTPHGLHFWFLAPGAMSNVWLGGRTLLLKGFGGYVVAPPSRNEEGEQYAWLGDWHIIDWLPDNFSSPLAARDALTVENPVTPQIEPYVKVICLPGKRFYTKRVWPIEGLCRAIEEAPDGNQNNLALVGGQDGGGRRRAV